MLAAQQSNPALALTHSPLHTWSARQGTAMEGAAQRLVAGPAALLQFAVTLT